MPHILAQIRTWHRPLMIAVATMTTLVTVSAIGLIVDHRQLLDASVWAKPLKFGISFVIYSATLAWMLPQLAKAKRTMWTLGTLFAATAMIDVGFIAIQAARGTYSHFNASTDTFNLIGQQIFSSGVAGLFGVSLVIAIMLLFQRVGDTALTWALRAGIALAALGMIVAIGIVGTASNSSREVMDATGHTVTLSGQHGVGAPDGSGMPITNWSLAGGDMRVPHFVGIHAVQVFVITALILAAAAAHIEWLRSARRRAQLTGVVITGHTGIFAITTWQAMRGQSLIHPDGATWTAVAALAAGTALAGALVIAAGRREHASATDPASALHEQVRPLP
ncbi:hypothetical protein [Pseudonocardia sp.]|jgi:hypothetical protein|uniref:hypothetical protein n=1 Tax=Pseudonocardia sp. TaxID=60912 RepID=UPI0031FBDAD8